MISKTNKTGVTVTPQGKGKQNGSYVPLKYLAGYGKSSRGEESRKSRAGRPTTQTAETSPSLQQNESYPLHPRLATSHPCPPSSHRLLPRQRTPIQRPDRRLPAALSRGLPRGRPRKAELTRSLWVGRRRGPVGRGPAPGVPLGGLPQVILEAHLSDFAATREPPQAVGRAP